MFKEGNENEIWAGTNIHFLCRFNKELENRIDCEIGRLDSEI